MSFVLNNYRGGHSNMTTVLQEFLRLVTTSSHAIASSTHTIHADMLAVPTDRCRQVPQFNQPPWLSYRTVYKRPDLRYTLKFTFTNGKHESGEKTLSQDVCMYKDHRPTVVWCIVHKESLKLRATSSSHLTNQLHSATLTPHANYALRPGISGC